MGFEYGVSMFYGVALQEDDVESLADKLGVTYEDDYVWEENWTNWLQANDFKNIRIDSWEDEGQERYFAIFFKDSYISAFGYNCPELGHQELQVPSNEDAERELALVQEKLSLALPPRWHIFGRVI